MNKDNEAQIKSLRRLFTIYIGVNISKRKSGPELTKKRKKLEFKVISPPVGTTGTVLSYVYSIFGLTKEWLRELSFSSLECGVHDKLHISSPDWWDLLLPLA